MTKQDFSIVRGDTFSATITITELVSDVATPVNLTGATCFFTAKSVADTDVTDAQAAISTSWTAHSSATEGITTINLSKTQTKVAVGDYYYDVQVVDSGGVVMTVLSGVVEIIKEITVRIS